MKTIYFIRHGQSEGNVGPVRQGPTGKLTEKGKEQAAIITERVAHLPFELMISSTMTRAQDTAASIIEKIKVPVVYSDLFVERRRPSIQIGKPKDDPQALEAEKIILKNFHTPDFHYSDEENFEDLKERAEKALAFLAARSEKNIVVATHGLFLRILAASIIFEAQLTSHECEQFIRKLQTENTGITVFCYDEEQNQKWSLQTWNDHAHLGE